MKTKILSKKEVRDITTTVVLANDVGAHASIAAGAAIVCGASKEAFLDACSRSWDAIAASVQAQLDEAIGEKGDSSSQP